jgi:hypothetical protein
VTTSAAHSGSQAEAVPVFRRRDAAAAVEGTPQHLGAGEAGRLCYGLERRGAVLEQIPGSLDPERLDVGRGGLADLAVEGAGE